MKKLLFVCVCLCFITHVKGQSTGVLISELSLLNNTAQNALEKADNILSDQQRQFYLNVVNYTTFLLGELKSLGNELDRKLTEKQIAILDDVRAISKQIEDESDDWQAKVDDLSVIIEGLPSKIKFIGDDTPIPLFYDVPIITTSQKKNLVITIKGVKLNNKKNYVLLNGKKYGAPIIPNDKRIIFNVPLTKNDIFSPDTLNILKLVLYKNRLLSSDKPYEYTSVFKVLPNTIGKLTISYTVNYSQLEESEIQTATVSATSGSNKEKEVKKQFNIVNSTADHWKIDKSSIKCRKSKGNGDKHGYGGPYQKTDISFTAKAYAKDGKAVCECKWREYRYIPKDSLQKLSFDINFNKQIVEQLPINTSKLVKAEIEYFDGNSFVTSSAKFTENHISFLFDNSKKLIEVKYTPKD